jgi:cystathionine gamma-synthase
MKKPASRVAIETLAVHAGRRPDPVTGAVAPALQPSTTYERDPDTGTSRGYSYQRDGHPNAADFESAMALLEGGDWGVSFASGSAATLALFHSVAARGPVLATGGAYRGTLRQFAELLPEWGAEVVLLDTGDLEAVGAATGRGAAMIYVETPSNPLLDVSDIRALARIAREAGAVLACDNTFATPVLQNPIALGADLVVHSATKYLGGHGDVLGGVVVGTNRTGLEAAVRGYAVAAGATLAPFNAWLLLRSLPTLPWRVRAQSATAAELARRLKAHPSIADVHYPGLPDHPRHALATRQMQGYGGMIAFRHAGGPEAARALPAKMQLITHATSLGGFESLIEHRASSEGPDSTAPPELLRLSVGLENVEDLWDDLDQALSS